MDNLGEIKSAVREVREGKELAKEFDVHMGRDSKDVNRISDNANFILAGLEDQYQHTLDKSYRGIQDYIGLSYPELQEHHGDGFKKFLKQQYTLYKKNSPGELKNFESDDYLEDLAIGYSFDYIRTLTMAKRWDLGPKTALLLASNAHWSKPEVLISLSRRFPDASGSLIVHAAIKNPKDPESYIERTLLTISRLEEKYPDVGGGIISTAAISYSNPDAFIEGTIAKIAELESKYPDVGRGVITAAALGHPKNPESFIESAVTKIVELQNKYPDLGKGVISTVLSIKASGLLG